MVFCASKGREIDLIWALLHWIAVVRDCMSGDALRVLPVRCNLTKVMQIKGIATSEQQQQQQQHIIAAG